MSSEIHYFVNETGEKTAVVLPIAEYERRVALGGGTSWRSFSPLEAALIGAGIAQSDPQRVHGAVCFVDAPRLPIDALFGNIDEGISLDEFCTEQYPDTVTKEVLEKALEVRKRLFSMGPVPTE